MLDGGFYSRDDLREIVAYAELRGVLVVPEVDLPGHVGAAVAAYPELGIPGRAPAEVPGGWGISSHVLNMRESTVAFCCDVLDELVDIFPSEVIGIGSDECPTEPWQSDPESVARAAELGLGVGLGAAGLVRLAAGGAPRRARASCDGLGGGARRAAVARRHARDGVARLARRRPCRRGRPRRRL